MKDAIKKKISVVKEVEVCPICGSDIEKQSVYSNLYTAIEGKRCIKCDWAWWKYSDYSLLRYYACI